MLTPIVKSTHFGYSLGMYRMLDEKSQLLQEFETFEGALLEMRSQPKAAQIVLGDKILAYSVRGKALAQQQAKKASAA